MKLEDKIKEQMEAMGTYTPAFDAEIHTLAGIQRDLTRAQKAWKAKEVDGKPGPAGSFTAPEFAVVQQLRKDLLAHRDALGLTVKGAKKMLEKKAQPGAQSPVSKLDEFISSLKGRVSANADNAAT